jgi:hypothetical protein
VRKQAAKENRGLRLRLLRNCIDKLEIHGKTPSYSEGIFMGFIQGEGRSQNFSGDYAAVDFFAGLGSAFGFTFLAAWAFCFAVNSCFTLRAMASVSTL